MSNKFSYKSSIISISCFKYLLTDFMDDVVMRIKKMLLIGGMVKDQNTWSSSY